MFRFAAPQSKSGGMRVAMACFSVYIIEHKKGNHPMNFAVRSRRVVTPEGVRPALIAVADGKITEVADFSATPRTGELLDVGDKMVLPGLVDTHVHVNEPGRTEWEGFATATRAAASGGTTTIVDMPLNCLPATTTVEALREKRKAANSQSWIDYGLWGGVVADNHEHLAALAEAGVLGYKCFLAEPGIDGFSRVTEKQLEAAMGVIARARVPLLTHAELPGPIDAARRSLEGVHHTDWRKFQTYLRSRPDEAELEAIRLMIQLARQTGCHVHIVHLSSSKALPDLRSARQEGLPVTAETCPHYLHLAAEDIPDGATQYKCAPPIRSRENREQLWSALREGVIDLIATDHSPCPPGMKQFGEGSFEKAWGGIASISIGLHIVWSEARRRGFTISDVVRWMAEKPAALAGLAGRKGRIQEAYDADLVVFDPDASFRVEKSLLHYRHPISPYLGEVLQGEVQLTFVRGKKVYDHGRFASNPPGRECARA
jgi:allantoinase